MGFKIVAGVTVAYGCKIIYNNCKVKFFKPQWTVETEEKSSTLRQTGEQPQIKVLATVKLTGNQNSYFLPDGHLVTRVETTNHWWGCLVRTISRNTHYGYDYKICFPMEKTSILRLYENCYPNVAATSEEIALQKFNTKTENIYKGTPNIREVHIREVRFAASIPNDIVAGTHYVAEISRQENVIPTTPYIKQKPDGTITVTMFRTETPITFEQQILSSNENNLDILGVTHYHRNDLRASYWDKGKGKLSTVKETIEQLVGMTLEEQKIFLNHAELTDKLNIINTITFVHQNNFNCWNGKNEQLYLALRNTVGNTLSPDLVLDTLTEPSSKGFF